MLSFPAVKAKSVTLLVTLLTVPAKENVTCKLRRQVILPLKSGISFQRGAYTSAIGRNFRDHYETPSSVNNSLSL